MNKWVKIGNGLEYRNHSKRKHGIQYDKYYRGRYTVGGKTTTVAFGYQSEGWSKEKCLRKLLQYKANSKAGSKPRSLKEEQELLRVQDQEDQEAEKLKRNERITLDEIASKYSAWAKDNKKSWYDDFNRYENHIKPQFGDKPVSKLCALDLERLKSKLKKQGKADATVRHCLVLVRQIVNKAILWRLWAGSNPVKGVAIPKPDNKRMRHLSQSEAEMLLQECKRRSLQLYEISLISLHTGMRAGEIFNLHWQDIDFKNGCIYIRQAKNNESRVVYMTDTVRLMLEGKLQGNPDDLVFESRTGQRIKSISKSFRHAVEKIGLNNGIRDRTQRVVFHTLRHTFASWLVQDGQGLFLVQKLLGHKTGTMTQRYAHLAPDNLKKAIQRFDKIVKPQHAVVLKENISL